MPAIVWTDKLSVKIPQIDRQHRMLIDLLNQLDDGMKAGHGKDVVATSLKSLLSYTRIHFVDEENLMKKYGYPEYSRHKMEHEDLVRRVMEFQQKQNAQFSLTVPLMNFLRDWLTNHIMGSDMRYSDFLRNKMAEKSA